MVGGSRKGGHDSLVSTILSLQDNLQQSELAQPSRQLLELFQPLL